MCLWRVMIMPLDECECLVQVPMERVHFGVLRTLMEVVRVQEAERKLYQLCLYVLYHPSATVGQFTRPQYPTWVAHHAERRSARESHWIPEAPWKLSGRDSNFPMLIEHQYKTKHGFRDVGVQTAVLGQCKTLYLSVTTNSRQILQINSCIRLKTDIEISRAT